MLAQKIGRKIIPVVEKYTELELILEYAEKIGVRPHDRHARQAGRARQRPLAVVGRLPLEVRPDGQRNPPRARRAESARHGRTASSCCTSIWAARSRTSASSRGRSTKRRASTSSWSRRAPGWNISTSAADWASTTTARKPISNRASTTRCRNTPTTSSITCRRVCDEAGVPHPTIVSESGRAVVAYHSVLVFNVLGVSGLRRERRAAEATARRCEQPLIDLIETYHNLTTAQRARELSRRPAGARHGDEPVHRRLSAARSAEHWPRTCSGRSAARCRSWCRQMEIVPEDLQGLDAIAVGHLLLQLLAVPVDARQLGDQAAVPGDADPPAERAADAARRAGRHHLRLGRQDRSVHRSPRREADAAAAHRSTASPTTSGVFLVGAYQEILGDLHNLFGDTNAVHVSLDDNGEVVLEAVIKGDTVREVLDYVEFDAEALIAQAAHRRRSGRPRRPARLRRGRPLPAVLRRRPAGLHLSGRAARAIARLPGHRGQDYSVRRTTSGLTRVARRAGT